MIADLCRKIHTNTHTHTHTTTLTLFSTYQSAPAEFPCVEDSLSCRFTRGPSFTPFTPAQPAAASPGARARSTQRRFMYSR